MLDFERILKDRGYRLTNQRRIIVHELEGERHLSAEEIYDRVKGGHPELGLSTVYRTLDLLTELGIVRKDDFGEGYSRSSWRRSGCTTTRAASSAETLSSSTKSSWSIWPCRSRGRPVSSRIGTRSRCMAAAPTARSLKPRTPDRPRQRVSRLRNPFPLR